MPFHFMKPKCRVKPFRKSEDSQEALDKLEEYVDSSQEEPTEVLEEFWKAQITLLTYEELRKILADQDVPEILVVAWTHDYSKLVEDKVVPLWKESVEAGVRSNPILEEILDEADFDASKLAEDWIKKHGAEMVTNMTDEQIQTIRQILGEAVYHKMSADETARYLRPIIGLTEPQAQANIRYYNNFKTQLAAAHPRMKTESIERKAREAAEKYAVKQRRVRAETIARTELITAYHKGNDLAVREGIRTGKLPKMKKVWSTSRDDKVCKACMALEGTEIEMDEEFKAKSGKRMIGALIPPLHPRCACAVKYVESDQKHDIMSLPRYEEAVIPEAKFTKYALNPDGDTNKARAFKEALGYDLSNYQDLIQNIRNNLPNSDAKPKGDKGYGMTYEVAMNMTGPNGKNAKVLTGWIADKESGEMRLTTTYIDKR